MNARFHVETNPRLKSLKEAMELQAMEMATVRDALDVRFRRNMQRLFATEGVSGGEHWAPLSAAYAKQKAKRYPGRKILARKGQLRRSLTSKGAGHIAEYTVKPKAKVELGTSVITAAYHAPGMSGKNPFRPNPNLPVRDVLLHTKLQLKDYQQAVWDYLREVKLKRVMRAMSAWRRAGVA